MTDVRNQEAQEAIDRASTYDAGFFTEIDTDYPPKALNEEPVR